MFKIDNYVLEQRKGTEHLRQSPRRLSMDINKIRVNGGMPLDQNAPVLCIGCRNGYEMYLLDMFGYHNLTGIDISAKMVAMGVLLGEFDIRLDDAMYCRTLRNQQFGAVLALHVFEHISDQPRALNRWGTLLQQGAKLSIIVPQITGEKTKFHVNEFQDQGQVAGVLKANGFGICHSSTFSWDNHSPSDILVIAQKG